VTGAYHRAIALTSEPGRVVAEMEDDFHHFRVILTHDGERVLSAEGEGLRYPWSTCAEAGTELRPLVGFRLTRSSTALAAQVSARANCTHMFDLAGLAVAQAGTGRSNRRYAIVVPDRVGPRTEPTIHRDGELVLEWVVEGNTIVGPDPFTGRELRGDFIAFAEQSLDEETAEAAIALRRAIYIASGRYQDLDGYETADEVARMTGGFMDGICYSFQRERQPVALRMKGTSRDFTGRVDTMLGEEP
jgi:hypothetical protein